MKVIFLDVDGVLTSNDYINKETYNIDEEKIKLLREIIDETDAKIVLNSTYKKYKDVKERNPYKVLEEMLKNQNIEIYDTTPVLITRYKNEIDPDTGLQIMGVAEPSTTRAGAIHTYLNQHKDIENFVIIDDIMSYYDYYGYEDNVVIPDRSIGLVLGDVKNSIDILNSNKKTR